MGKDEVLAIFTLAGIPVLAIRPLPDGYGYDPEDPRYFTTLPRQVWWFVKTPVGWIEIGWRKRVISINWSDTPIRTNVTQDDVTKDLHMVHAWSEVTAVHYLKVLLLAITMEQQKG